MNKFDSFTSTANKEWNAIMFNFPMGAYMNKYDFAKVTNVEWFLDEDRTDIGAFFEYVVAQHLKNVPGLPAQDNYKVDRACFWPTPSTLQFQRYVVPDIDLDKVNESIQKYLDQLYFVYLVSITERKRGNTQYE